ncbi:MAG: tetratricopeptide repeat protein, partial [Anaerolineae bacterium]|nr:tetratricopeptide repeat protein [Anaerolineae bacterium]
HCQTQLLFDELLQAVREANPRQYERYQAQLCSDSAVHLPAPQIPHNLPPRSEFIGREVEKARIHEALRSRYFLISIDGIGGIGKTSLALEVAYECLQASQSDDPPEGLVTFDSFVWATAKDRDLTLNTLLDAIALTLDYPGMVQRPLDQKRIGVEKLLREIPCLLIVDNFETVTDDEVKDFLRYLPEPSKALITTREQNLSHVWAISLKGLEEPEALALIRGEGRRLGLPSIEEAEDTMLLYLHKATGGIPLALKWSVGQIKQRGQSLDGVLTALHEARGSIFEDIFARSWDLLSPDAQQVLMVMPLFATSASRNAIEATSKVTHFVLDEALGQLVEMFLIDVTEEFGIAQLRYGIHPLVRSFTGAKIRAQIGFEQRARSRLVSYYVQECAEKGGWVKPQGLRWIEIEFPNIVSAIEQANLDGEWMAVTSIFGNIAFFLGSYGFRGEGVKYGNMALESARKARDPSAIALCQHALGWLSWKQGHYQEALVLLRTVPQLHLETGDTDWANRARITLAKSAVAQGDLEFASEVISNLRSEDQKVVEHGLLTVKGRIALKSGDLDRAKALLLRALEIATDKEYRIWMGGRYIDLGNVALAQNQIDEADNYFAEGLRFSQEYYRRDKIARANYGLARVRACRGTFDEALSLAHRARDQFFRMGMQQEVKDADAFLQQLRDSCQARGQASQ